MFDRVIVIVLDSVGIGELPDAALYEDQGSNTLGNIAAAVPLNIPTLAAMGMAKRARAAAMEPIAALIGFGMLWATFPPKMGRDNHATRK